MTPEPLSPEEKAQLLVEEARKLEEAADYLERGDLPSLLRYLQLMNEEYRDRCASIFQYYDGGRSEIEQAVRLLNLQLEDSDFHFMHDPSPFPRPRLVYQGLPYTFGVLNFTTRSFIPEDLVRLLSTIQQELRERDEREAKRGWKRFKSKSRQQQTDPKIHYELLVLDTASDEYTTTLLPILLKAGLTISEPIGRE